MDTHINAYFADVDEKQKAFEQAGAELQEARNRLEVKKSEIGYVEPEVTKQDKPVENTEELQPNTGSAFNKKK